LIASGVSAKVEGYVEGVLSGDIVACQRVKDAVRRYVADLERQSSAGFPYHFDRRWATTVCDFFPVVLKHSIGEFAGRPLILEPWQAFSIWNIFGWKRDDDNSRRFRKVYWSMGRKNGKALALDTLLPTPTGYTTMGEVQVGDFLISPSGKPVRVLATTEIMHDRPCYEMTFSTGEKVICDENHEWVTDARINLVGCRGVGRKMGESTTKTRTTKDISESLVFGTRRDLNHSIKVSSAIQLDEARLPIAPYTLGAWLGDGNSDSARITCSYLDHEVIERIRQDGYFCEESKSTNQNTGIYCIRKEKKRTRGGTPHEIMREIGVLGNKHIPIAYLRASREQRMELLRGLMDTDGYISKSNGQCEFVSISERLAVGVKELVCSLGVKCTIRKTEAKLNGVVVSDKFRVFFFAFDEFVPFHLKRKAQRVPKRTSTKKPRGSSRQIAGCKKIRSVPVKCVQVEGGLYTCTDSFIATHNSTIAAGLCLFLGAGDIDPKTGKPEAVGQILLTGPKKEQAAIVYGECERMRMQAKALMKISHVKNETITFNHNKTYIKKISSDKPCSGLNPTLVVMDELHEWGEYTRDFYDTMVTGSSARSQPLQLVITTAGADDSYLWLENYNYACEVLKGNFTDESTYAIIYEFDEQDDPSDESVWMKSNPNLGVSVNKDYLHQRWNEDQHSAVGKSRFIRYHGNRVVASTEKAFDIAKFDKCVGPLSDWSKAEAFGAGVDLGSRDDLAAYAVCARFPVDVTKEGKTVYRYEIKCRTYIASDSKRDLAAMPFAGWIYSGELSKCQYPLSELEQDLDAEMMTHGIDTLAYDPYNGQVTGENLAAKGITAARMAQNPSNFNEPIRDFLVLMDEGRLLFDDSKMLRWCFNNAVIARDRQDRWMFDKRESKDKIDPVVASVMAYRIASLQPAKVTGSLYVV